MRTVLQDGIARVGDRMGQRLKSFNRLLLAGLVLLTLLLLGPVLTIPLHVPTNYNEGWNAGFDTRAVLPGAGPLYPGADSFVFNNYPPLGFFIVGAAGRFVFGDMIVAGRFLALAALLATAALTGLCVRQLGGRIRAAAAAALLLLLFVCTFYRGYVAMDDPQWLAHALMLGSLALLLRGGLDRNRAKGLPIWQIVTASLLMVAGGFVKHNLVALPAAVTLWLAWLDVRAASAWLMAAAVGLGLGLGATDALFGHVAFVDVLQHHRIFRLHLATHAIRGLAPLLPMAAIVAALLRRRSFGDGAVLAALFGSMALIVGIVQRMGEGVNYNAHFETIIALCLGFGLVLTPVCDCVARWRGRPLGPASLCIIAALPVIGAMPWHLPLAWREVAGRAAREASWQPMIARLAASKGPVGCEMQSICYWARKPFSVDVFNLTQNMVSGGPIAPFRTVVARRGFALFAYDPSSAMHRDAVRKLGYDPVVSAFAGIYAPATTGPKGMVLLSPVDATTANPVTGQAGHADADPSDVPEVPSLATRHTVRCCHSAIVPRGGD